MAISAQAALPCGILGLYALFLMPESPVFLAENNASTYVNGKTAYGTTDDSELNPPHVSSAFAAAGVLGTMMRTALTLLRRRVVAQPVPVAGDYFLGAVSVDFGRQGPPNVPAADRNQCHHVYGPTIIAHMGLGPVLCW